MPPNRQAVAIIEPVEDTRGLGPAMKAINPQQRAFVMALLETGGQDNTLAARMAGYGGDSATGVRTTAYRLAHDAKVVEAIREHADKTIRSSVALGASVLVEIARDTMHKDRFKAANALLDRGGLLLVQKSEVHHTHTDGTTKEMIAEIVALAEKMGIDPAQLLGQGAGSMPGSRRLSGPVVDAEFTEVAEPTLEGLEDLI